VSHVVVIGESLAGSERAVGLAQRAGGGLSATAGVHPHEASAWSGETWARIRELLSAAETVAVGETGLDYHYLHSPKEDQRRAFEAHLALGAELDKPVIVHAREADEDLAAMLANVRSRPPVIVLHSFSSGAAVWEAGMAINAYFSFSGMITFKNWTMTDRLSACPPDRLLVETDAPYLAPVPHRGKRNEPGFVRDVGEREATFLPEPFDALARRTTENARRCFGPRIASTL